MWTWIQLWTQVLTRKDSDNDEHRYENLHANVKNGDFGYGNGLVMMTMVVIKMKMMTMLVMTVMTVMMMTAGSAVARYGNAAHAAATRANRDIADDALKEIGPLSGFGSSL